MSRKNGKKKRIVVKVLIGILIVVATGSGVIAIGNTINRAQLLKYARTFDKIEYDNQLVPTLDSEDYYCFTTDDDFKIVKISDVHIGGGIMSRKQDRMAINAVGAMISYEKPDLVITTGDVAFPVPYEALTFNNKIAHDVYAALMEQLGVYWTVTFGNHDSEVYNYYNREKVAKMYANEEYKYCLFQERDLDIKGEGNNIIKLKKSNGLINKALFTIDSNQYLDDDPLGIKWHYEAVAQDQIDWYAAEIDKMNAYNNSLLSTLTVANPEDYSTVQSVVFQHIPVSEFGDAYKEYTDNNNIDTADTKYIDGIMGEAPGDKISFCPTDRTTDVFFKKIVEKGSTKALFCGHDHLNNQTFEYKGVLLSYGLSIDYLAYPHIEKYGEQRGCHIIMLNADSSIDCSLENYYQEKYVSKYEKEIVTFDHYYEATEAQRLG